MGLPADENTRLLGSSIYSFRPAAQCSRIRVYCNRPTSASSPLNRSQCCACTDFRMQVSRCGPQLEAIVTDQGPPAGASSRLGSLGTVPRFTSKSVVRSRNTRLEEQASRASGGWLLPLLRLRSSLPKPGLGPTPTGDSDRAHRGTFTVLCRDGSRPASGQVGRKICALVTLQLARGAGAGPVLMWQFKLLA